MSDPKQDHESDVAIAAESRLDHESGADLQDANHKVGATPLIMGALEKLASATDQMAQQIGDRLDTATEQQISREQGMRQTLAEGLDAIGERNDKVVDRLADRIEERLSNFEPQDDAERFDDLAQRLETQAETVQQRIGEIRGEIDRAVESLGQAQGPVQDSIVKLDGRLSGVNERFDQLGKDVAGILDAIIPFGEKIAALPESIGQNLDSHRDAVVESQKESQKALVDEIQSLRQLLAETSETQDRRFEEFANEMRDGFAKMQRSIVGDLAEGIGLAQTSAETRFDSLDAGIASWRDEHEARFGEWTQKQSERVESLERESTKLSELGARLERNHDEVVSLVEQERVRIADIEKGRTREQARRVNNSGVARYHAGDFAQSRQLFEQAVDLDNLFAEAYNNLGLALTELDEHEDATVAFETAVELDPELGAGYNNLGYVLYRQENFEAAIEMYKEAIGRKHDTSSAYTNLGNAYQKLGHTEKAVEAWRSALEADPANDRARGYLTRYGADVVVPQNDDAPANV